MGKIFSVRDNSKDVQDTPKRMEKRDDDLGKNQSKEKGIKGDSKQTLTIDFSPKLMLFVILILAFIYFARQLLTVIFFLFFGFVIMSSIKPVVNWLRKKGVSKGISITIAYFFLILIIISLLVLVSVPFVNQLSGLVRILPAWITESLFFLEDFSIAGYSLNIEIVTEYITDFVKAFPTSDNFRNVAGIITDFFSIGAFIVTSLIFSVYLVSEHDTFADILLIKIVSDEKRERVRKLVMDVETKLGNWVLGQAVVSLCASVFTWIVLTILGVPFALPLAMFTGFMDLIPNLGSTLAGFVMSLVALISVGPLSALIVLVAYILYQPIENGVITPKVMGNAVGLKPIVVLLGVIVSLIFFGIIGGFVAVPLLVVSQIVYEFYIDLQKLKAKGIV